MYGLPRSISLGFLVIVALAAPALLLTTSSLSAQTETGGINVTGTVAGPPPNTAPAIDNPFHNTTSEDKNIAVDGSCTTGLVVKIFRNNVFAGSTICREDGTFGLNIDLFEGRNDLLARQYDIANQTSPDSELVTVFYVNQVTQPTLPDADPNIPSAPNAPAGVAPQPVPTATANFQLVIDYDYTVQGVFDGKTFSIPISFAGGNAPYALNIDWGDGNSSLYSRESDGRFIADHVYKSAGFKTVTIKVSDSTGDISMIQFVILVNGATSAPIIRQLFGSQVLIEHWPLIVLPSAVAGIALGTIAGVGLTHWIQRRRQPPPAQT